EVDREAVERLDRDAIGSVPRFTKCSRDDRDALTGAEERLLAGVGEDTDDDRVEDTGRAADDVQVPVRDRIERSGVDRDRHRDSLSVRASLPIDPPAASRRR